ncbi:MAG: TolC family protein [Fermentimonas sp.]|nr:TolC family protein [Fermentimonas sp.]
MKIIINILAIFAFIPLFAQNSIDSVLTSIEKNNTTLKSLRETAEAQKLENRTGIYLSNPEAEFGYLWGDPSAIGRRTDFSVTQSFDIPTLTGMKSKVANEKNNLVEWQYKAERMSILLEAKKYCLDLIYYNALMTEMELRLQHAETILAGYKERLDKGYANVIEYNKVQLNLSTVQGEILRIETERNTILSHLKRLNGGIDLAVDENSYRPIQLPPNFDDWYLQAEQKSPALAYIKQEVEVNKNLVSLNKAMRLPTFSAGYMTEKVVGESYRGFIVGVSIPLWENTNRIKQAKRAVIAAESRETDSKQQFYSNLFILYNRTLGLQATAQTFRKSLEVASNTTLLKKALDAGEISLLDYMIEIGLYYETINQALEAEREYQKAFAELSATEL